jgi:signal transduction histidine kinase
LRETEAALRRSEQERRGLVAAIAHDLKNPLTSIKGLAQMLQRQADAGSLTPERLSDRLGALVASADRMTAQLDELSLITRGEDLRIQLDRRRTDLVTLVREAAAGRQLGSEAHAIQLECNVEQLVGSFDATRLARVVDNLLVNAVKYSPSGGTVTVQVRRTERAGVPWACLTVRDRGIGIPDADLPHVFERFRRGGNVRGISGTGVGLAAVREIVEAHGGTIEVASREGEGSTFTVWLPLVESEAQAGQP